MKITTYIVDDETPARERMEYLINTFLSDDVVIVGKSESPNVALKEIPILNPDIAFLDVEMSGTSGLELAGKLNAKGFKGKIIFVTAYGHYSIKAIRAGAFDYLLKPVDVDELKNSIERFKAKTNIQFNPDAILNFELSEREMELIGYLAKGLSSEEIAEQMFLSKHTVDTHRRNILLKTGARNTVELLNLLRV